MHSYFPGVKISAGHSKEQSHFSVKNSENIPEWLNLTSAKNDWTWLSHMNDTPPLWIQLSWCTWWSLQKLCCRPTYLPRSALEPLPKVRFWFQHVHTELVRNYSDKIFFSAIVGSLRYLKNFVMYNKTFPKKSLKHLISAWKKVPDSSPCLYPNKLAVLQRVVLQCNLSNAK